MFRFWVIKKGAQPVKKMLKSSWQAIDGIFLKLFLKLRLTAAARMGKVAAMARILRKFIFHPPLVVPDREPRDHLHQG